ncbi:unnamed protein product [Closterium sp. NIES-53]
MSGDPFTVFVADDLAPADVELWLSFDEAVLPHPPPPSDDHHFQTQFLPELPFNSLDPSLAFLIGDDAPIGDAYVENANTDNVPTRVAPANHFEVSPDLRLNDLLGELTERRTQPDSDGVDFVRRADTREACTDGSGEADAIITSFADLIDAWDSSGVSNSHGTATREDGQVETVESLHPGTGYVTDAGNVIAASNLVTCLPEPAAPSTWLPDQPRNAELGSEQGFPATSAYVLRALQPDGSRPQVLTFEEASERLFAAVAPAPFQSARGRCEQVQREQAPRAQLLLPGQEEAQNQLLAPQEQLQQQPQQQGQDHDLGEQQQQQQQQQGALRSSIPPSTRPLRSAIHARPSSPQRSSPAQRLSPYLGGDIGVGGIRGPPADHPSAPPPSKLPRRPPDLSSRLAAVLQNINPPGPATSPWQTLPCLPKPGLPCAATPAAPAAPAAPSASTAGDWSFPVLGSSAAAAAISPAPPTAAAAAAAVTATATAGATTAAVAAAAVELAVASAVSCIQAPESRLVVGSSRGDASGSMGSTQLSSAARTSYAATYGYDQRVQWPGSSSDSSALGRIRVSMAHSNPLNTAWDSAGHSAASRASVATPHVVEFGPERPLRLDLSGLLPRPMSGAREGMLKQQLMALAEAMAVDDSVRWRQFMRQVRREAAAGGDTLQRIAFHALEALQARMDGTGLTRWRTPLKVTLQDSLAAMGHGNEHGMPAFMHLANTAAVHEIVHAFTRQPHAHARTHPHAHGHGHAPHSTATLPHNPHPPAPAAQRASVPASASASASQSVRRRRLYIIAIGFYGGPHWINILMRLAAHFSTPPLLPTTAAVDYDLPPSGIPSTNPPTPLSHAAPPPRPMAHVKITAVDFGVVKVEEYPTGLVHLGGQYLEQVASMLGLSLTFHGIETTPHEFHPSQVEVDEGEEVVVLANWGLMVFPDDTVLRSNPRNAILKWIRDLRPLLLLQVDIDLDANGPFFLSRFHAAFANFAAFVESFDASMPHAATPRFAVESILAHDFINGVACEGMNRWLRSERLEKWVHRMKVVGLEPVPLGPDTVAAGREITEGKDGRFRLEVHAETGALQLSWRGVPMLFVAAWR